MTNKTAICPKCDKPHKVDNKTFSMFGVDTICMPCVGNSHIKFMKKNAKKFGLTCVPGCPCGFGA